MKAYTIIISQDFAGPSLLNIGFPNLAFIFQSLLPAHTSQMGLACCLMMNIQFWVWLVLSLMSGMLISSLITFHTP